MQSLILDQLLSSYISQSILEPSGRIWRRRRESAQALYARLLFRRCYRSSAEVCRPSTGRPSFRLLPSQGSTPSYQFLNIKTGPHHKGESLFSYGGEGGSRTLARVTPPKALAKPPLQPLGYFSVSNYQNDYSIVGGESGIRTHGRLSPSPVFKTGALNQLDHLSKSFLSTMGS